MGEGKSSNIWVGGENNVSCQRMKTAPTALSPQGERAARVHSDQSYWNQLDSFQPQHLEL